MRAPIWTGYSMLEAELAGFDFHSNSCLHPLPRECLETIPGQGLKELPQGWGPCTAEHRIAIFQLRALLGVTLCHSELCSPSPSGAEGRFIPAWLGKKMEMRKSCSSLLEKDPLRLIPGAPQTPDRQSWHCKAQMSLLWCDGNQE